MAEHDPLTERVIACAFHVQNTLGCGFLEKVYENALAHACRKAGLSLAQQHPIHVHYEGQLVGVFAADLFIENSLIVELKTVKALDSIHMAQCLNYLKATQQNVCLLLNFGKPQVEIRRILLQT